MKEIQWTPGWTPYEHLTVACFVPSLEQPDSESNAFLSSTTQINCWGCRAPLLCLGGTALRYVFWRWIIARVCLTQNPKCTRRFRWLLMTYLVPPTVVTVRLIKCIGVLKAQYQYTRVELEALEIRRMNLMKCLTLIAALVSAVCVSLSEANPLFNALPCPDVPTSKVNSIAKSCAQTDDLCGKQCAQQIAQALLNQARNFVPRLLLSMLFTFHPD